MGQQAGSSGVMPSAAHLQSLTAGPHSPLLVWSAGSKANWTQTTRSPRQQHPSHVQSPMNGREHKVPEEESPKYGSRKLNHSKRRTQLKCGQIYKPVSKGRKRGSGPGAALTTCGVSNSQAAHRCPSGPQGWGASTALDNLCDDPEPQPTQEDLRRAALSTGELLVWVKLHKIYCKYF